MKNRMSPLWAIATPLALTWAAALVVTVSVVQLTSATPAQAQSVSACDSYAHNYARRRTRGMATNAAARNALVGAGIGSLVDGRRGARRGATLGLGAGVVTGGISAYNEYEIQFNRAFRRCMRL